MVDLKTLIGKQEGSKWFEYRDGFELCLRYLPKREAKRIQSVRADKQDEEFYKLVVSDWRGLTARKLSRFCKVDGRVAPESLNEEIPFSYEGLMALVDAVYGLDDFVVSLATDHRSFQSETWGEELKNSVSGESIASPQKPETAKPA